MESRDNVDATPSQASPDTQTRQKSSAALQTIDPVAVLAKFSGSMTAATADIIHNIQSYCVVPNQVQAPGVESAGYREDLKHKADAMSRLPQTTFLRQLLMSCWGC